MTREIKLALLLGFALVLAVGVLISDHLSAVGDALEAPPHRAAAGEAASPGLGRGLLDPDPNRALLAAGGPDRRSLITDLTTRPAPPAAGVEHEPRAADAEPGPAEFINDPEHHRRELVGRAADRTDDRSSWPRHRVQRNESLWKIAEAYYGDGSLHRHLARVNEGRVGPNGTIRPGTTLFVPPRHILLDRPDAGAPPAPAGPAPARSRTYTIRAGDTLVGIARSQLGDGARWHEIRDLNRDRIPDPDSIPVGTTIRLPS